MLWYACPCEARTYRQGAGVHGPDDQAVGSRGRRRSLEPAVLRSRKCRYRWRLLCLAVFVGVDHCSIRGRGGGALCFALRRAGWRERRVCRSGHEEHHAISQKAIDAKDSIGGIVECRANGLPVGLGEPFFDSVESVISHAVFAIPAIRGVEFGTGFAAARMFGADHNDAIEDKSGKTRTNHAGGVVGGISNGNELVFRIAVKPTSSTPKEQQTYNWETGGVESFSVKGRHDLCIALRVPVVLEAVTALVLVDLLMLEQHIKRIL